MMGDFPFLEYLARLYQKRAQDTGRWWHYIKAHGLANACIARDCNSGSRAELVYQIESDWYKGNHPLSFSEHRDLTTKHKQLLDTFRQSTRENFDSLKGKQESLSIFDIFSETTLSSAHDFAKSVFCKSKMCGEGFIKFSEHLIKCSADILSQHERFPPCEFAVLGLGSVSRGEVTPFSDLEYVFLVESDNTIDYFWRLAIDSYFRINNLGESPLKVFAIEEIGGKSAISETVVGYRFDGFSSQAGNIPTGAPGQPHKIRTVAGMMELYKSGLQTDFGDKAGNLPDLLHTSVIIYSSSSGERLHGEFLHEKLTFEENEGKCDGHITRKRLQTFSKDMEGHSFLPQSKRFGPPKNYDIKTKTDIFRFPTLLAYNFSVALVLDAQYAWDIFSILCEKGYLSEENCRYLQIVLGLSLYTRTVAYLVCGTKCEMLSLYTYNQFTPEVKCQYHVPVNIFITLGCLLVPIKECTNDRVRQIISVTNIAEVSASTKSETFNIDEAMRSVLNSLHIVKSDFLLLVEVSNFVGKPNIALKQLYYAVGEQNVNSSCAEFLKIIHDKYKAQKTFTARDDKKLAEICCYILYSERKYSPALEYLSWLIDNENCSLCEFRWKVLKGQCLNHRLAYVDAYKTLISMFHDLKNYLQVEQQHTFYGHLKNCLLPARCNTGGTEHRLLLEVVSHAYKTLANTSQHLKIFGLANECIRISKMTSEALMHHIGANNRRFEVRLTDLLGTIYADKGEYDKSLHYHTESLRELETMHGVATNHGDIASVYNNFGRVYRKKGEYKKSLDCHHQALDMRRVIFSEHQDHPDIAECLADIGIAHMESGNFMMALKYNKECLQMGERLKCSNLTAKGYYNSSLVYMKLGWYLKSLEQLHEALHYVKNCIAFTSETKHPDLAEYYREIANVYSHLCDIRMSFDSQKTSEDMIKDIQREINPYTSTAFNDLVNVNRLRDQHIQHIQSVNQALDAHMLQYGENASHPDIAKGYSNMATLYQYLGEYTKSHRYFEASLRIWKDICGENAVNAHIASCYRNLGDVYSSMCDYASSLKYYNQSLEIGKLVYGENANHPDIATSYNNLGKVKTKVGRYTESLILYQTGLAMRQLVFGENFNHPDVADSYHNIGTLYNEMGLYKESIDCHTKSLNMRKALYGTVHGHHEIAKSYIYISDVYLRTGKFNCALEYCKMALDMAHKVYGQESNHPIIGCSYSFMASAHRRTSNYIVALDCCNKALAMAKVVYGPESKHHDIARVYNNLGNIYEDQGRHEEAWKFYKEALEHKRSIYGGETNHPGLSISYINIGFSNYKLNEYATAFKFYKEAIAIWKLTYGDDSCHLYLAIAYNYMGLGYSSMGKYDKSLEYHTRSLNMMNSTFGEGASHPEKAKIFTKTAIMYVRMGEYTKALECLFQSLVMLDTVFEGEVAVNLVASNYRHIGNTYRHLRKFVESQEYLTLSLNALQQIYGENANQCDIAEVYCQLGRLYSMVGQYEQAFTYQRMSLEMREQLGHTVYVSQSFRALGKLYHRTKQYEYALHCFARAVPVSTKYPILESVQLFTNIATTLLEKSENSRAKWFLQRALEKEPKYDHRLIAYIDYLLGCCYLQRKKFFSSWSCLTATLKFYEKEPQFNKQVIVQVKTRLAMSHLFRQIGKLPQALAHSQKALQLCHQLAQGKDVAIRHHVRLQTEAHVLYHSLLLVSNIEQEVANLSSQA